MTTIGYARVSSPSQSLDGQRAALHAAGCSIIRAEKVSAASRDGRNELKTILDFIREGDELVVQRIDRLGRRVIDVLAVVDELKVKLAVLRVLEPPISTSDQITGQIVITALSMAAELERTFLLDRQREGIERRLENDRLLPRAQRAYRGRRPVIDAEKIRTLHAQGFGATKIAKFLKISRMSVYRALNENSFATLGNE